MHEVARAVTADVGLDGYRAGLMPEEKAEYVRELIASGERVAMVGDGVNDAPALKTATVNPAQALGFAGGTIEAGGVVSVRFTGESTDRRLVLDYAPLERIG